jgi:hypothetical protein
MNKQIILDDQDKILTKQAQEAVAVHNLGNAGYELTAMPSAEWDAHVEKQLKIKFGSSLQ